ncbi:hypothetical protein OG21DRAFT_1485129 [Imleria badia]|nr:hypothetical protein OG21DRAFT_1485129 [Imleria badia]
MKAQEEYRLRLRTLEKLLLQALNESSGNILDDDKVISTLEEHRRIRDIDELTHLLADDRRNPSTEPNSQILPKSRRPSPDERSALMRGALERKKAALLLLTEAQRDIENHAAWMIEERGLDETIKF